jgi:hypothetical protein
MTRQNTLVTIDGIAIFDHERLLNYDPLKVKTVSLHKNTYYIGNNIFEGIAQFHTYTGKYPGLTLGKNASIFDFEGVQYPCLFSGRGVGASDNLPDERSLLYWNPQVDLISGESREIAVGASSLSEKYNIVLEGVTESGRPIFYKSEFTMLLH